MGGLPSDSRAVGDATRPDDRRACPAAGDARTGSRRLPATIRRPGPHHLEEDRELADAVGVVVGDKADLAEDRVPWRRTCAVRSGAALERGVVATRHVDGRRPQGGAAAGGAWRRRRSRRLGPCVRAGTRPVGRSGPVAGSRQGGAGTDAGRADPVESSAGRAAHGVNAIRQPDRPVVAATRGSGLGLEPAGAGLGVAIGDPTGNLEVRRAVEHRRLLRAPGPTCDPCIRRCRHGGADPGPGDIRPPTGTGPSTRPGGGRARHPRRVGEATRHDRLRGRARARPTR